MQSRLKELTTYKGAKLSIFALNICVIVYYFPQILAMRGIDYPYFKKMS